MHNLQEEAREVNVNVVFNWVKGHEVGSNGNAVNELNDLHLFIHLLLIDLQRYSESLNTFICEQPFIVPFCISWITPLIPNIAPMSSIRLLVVYRYPWLRSISTNCNQKSR